MTRTKKARPSRVCARIHDDDGISPPVSQELSSSSSSLPPSSTQLLSPEMPSSSRPQTPDELITTLTDIGFDGATDFVIEHGFDRVLAALERGLSRPPGLIENLPGYIRSLVTQRGPIPKPDPPAKPGNKYTSGRFGHVVKR